MKEDLTPEQREELLARNREKARRWREANPEKYLAQARASKAKRKEENAEYARKWKRKNRKRWAKYMREYRAENPEIMKVVDRRHYLKQREQDIEKCRLWGRLKTERRREMVKANFPLLWKMERAEGGPGRKRWREANKEYIAAYVKWWRKTPKGMASCKTSSQRRRARKMASEGNVTAEEWLECLAEFDNRCFYCGESFTADLPATMEHMIALDCGGLHRIDNIVPACGPCNSKKGTKTALEFLEQLLAET